MCQHVCNGRGIPNVETRQRFRPEEIPSFLADVCEMYSTTIAHGAIPPSCETDIFIVASIKDGW